MGFLRTRSTTRFFLEDPTPDNPEGWWVDLRDALPIEEFQEIMEAMPAAQADAAAAALDVPMLTDASLLPIVTYLVGWNLTDEDDELLPSGNRLEIMQSVRRFPVDMFLKLTTKVGTLINPEGDKTEEVRFRGAGDVDPEGLLGGGSAPGRGGVLPEGVAVAEPGADTGAGADGAIPVDLPALP